MHRVITREIEVPSVAEIQRQAAHALADGFALRGAGPFRRVAGGKARTPIVGPSGCTCALGRHGEWCFHRSMLAVALGQVPPPVATAAARQKPVRKDRGGRMPRPLRPIVPVPITPMDRLRARNRALWRRVA